MPDLEQLRGVLAANHPQAWVDHLLASFRDEYFRTFDASSIDRHLSRMRSLSDARPVTIDVTPDPEPGGWFLEVVGHDAFQFLSTLTMLLTIHDLSIDQAWIFTSELPPEPVPATPSRRPIRSLAPAPSRLGPAGRTRRAEGPDRRRRLVDAFRLRQRNPHGSPPDWTAFQAELTDLAQLLRDKRHDEVHHRLIGRYVASLPGRDQGPDGLEPLELTIDPDLSEFATVVQVRAHDNPGFLSLTASALSLCGIRIVQADICTTGAGRVDDTLWVTDRAGRKIVAESQVRALKLSLILIEHFSAFLPHAADPEAALLHFSRFANEMMTRADWAEEFAALDRPAVLDALVRLLGESEFLWTDYLRDQTELILPVINEPSGWKEPPSPDVLDAELSRTLEAQIDPEERRRAIRRVRDREVFRAGLRAILGESTPEGFARELTEMAQVVMRAAFREALAEAAREVKSDPPMQLDGSPVPSTLCALGKFGGRELGFGSDLELMLLYDDRRAADPLATSAYFDAAIRGLRAVMGVQIGGTFELDFRLRPYGKGGPPATSLSSFETYYQVGGPAWSYERQALIRLRAVAGDAELARQVEAHRDRYVYGPEPIDPAELRRLRSMQVKQLVVPGTINAKFSPGALVDIEYAVQALQITFGHDDPSLRTPNTLEALDALEAAGRLDAPSATTLRDGYRFCRALIDALRVVRGNARDLTVPPADSDAFAILARRMRRNDLKSFQNELQTRLRSIREVTERLEAVLSVSAASREPGKGRPADG